MAESNMNSDTTYSIYGECQSAMLSCFVEKPPVAVVAIEWHTASNIPIPPDIRSTLSTPVNRI